jgi:hypothetical protein
LELFRRLKDDPGTEGWIVLHSLDLASHVEQVAGEADFVVIVPGEGVLVIEVKSHLSIRVDEEGWHLGRSLKPEERGPFKQASTAMHSLRYYLLDRDRSFGSLVTWSAVCFPRVDFRIKSSEWHDWQVIDRSRLTSGPLSRTIRGILHQGRQLLIQRGVSCAAKPEVHASPQRCSSVAAALRPKFEVAMSPKTRRQEVDRELLMLTEEQFSALDQTVLNPRVVFSGPAGTGKTVLAMEALRRHCAEQKSSRAALFCYNKLLGNELSAQGLAVMPGATVGHMDAWLSEVARDRITPQDRNSRDFFEGRLALLAIDCLLADDSGTSKFDFVVLDEAQDLLRPHYLDVLDLVLEGGLAGGRWLMMGDFVGQDIFSRGEITLDEFVETRSPSAARFLLTTNCRNTVPISNYVVSLGQLKPPYVKVLRGDDRQDPELEFWKDRPAQVRKVAEFLKKCLEEGFSPGDIVLLSPVVDGSVGQELALDPEWSAKIAPWGVDSGRIGYATIQAFKGMEAPVVILTDFEVMETGPQQSLFYIGLSRALHRLGIFLHEGLKPFIRSIT